VCPATPKSAFLRINLFTFFNKENAGFTTHSCISACPRIIYVSHLSTSSKIKAAPGGAAIDFTFAPYLR
jgi:hypothetical protein